MNSEIFGVIVQFLVAIALSIPLGNYIARVYLNKPTFFRPINFPNRKVVIQNIRYQFRGTDELETTFKCIVND